MEATLGGLDGRERSLQAFHILARRLGHLFRLPKFFTQSLEFCLRCLGLIPHRLGVALGGGNSDAQFADLRCGVRTKSLGVNGLHELENFALGMEALIAPYYRVSPHVRNAANVTFFPRQLFCRS
jgi:hypothetical protein